MAIAVLFKYAPDTGKTTTDVFQTPEHDDPVHTALALKKSCEDDFPGHIWAIGQDQDARDIMTNTRMHDMGFPDYDHAKAEGRK